MLQFAKFRTTFNTIQSKTLQTLNPILPYRFRYCRFSTNPSFNSHDPSSNSGQRIAQKNVAIFWDLDNKPPKSFPPYDAALRLKKAAMSFGFIRYMIAYANQHAFSYVPVEVRKQRKERKALDQLENMGVLRPNEPYICRVCGRRFYNNEKLINHFKLHEREQTKRLNQIESARGKRRVKLVGKFSMKIEKYKSAARDVLTPKVGYGLGDELKRAGFWVRTVSNKPQAADISLRNHMVDMMDKRLVECVILVSDDTDFVELLKEARLRCLKTVVVGDCSDGALKRTADAAFSWQEIMLGKAKKEAVSVVSRWKDRDVLKKLEWTYNPEKEKITHDSTDEADVESEGSDAESFYSEEDGNSMQKDDCGAWWELEADTVRTSS
ncbi:hypothetical protein RJ639_026837 [Escallonia herrerae]|uniref:C2H2-type domain-containing protein n=1 Tax=Escallonia herrerae TaxID=1293975 RepID=A0AA89BG47_9ASTE|nr:hypothetical protein RJ639_026837 [Escallonia herrerae]